LWPRQFSHSLPPPFLPGPKQVASSPVTTVPSGMGVAAITGAGAAAAAKSMSRLRHHRPAAESMFRRRAASTVAIGTMAAIMVVVMAEAMGEVMTADMAEVMVIS